MLLHDCPLQGTAFDNVLDDLHVIANGLGFPLDVLHVVRDARLRLGERLDALDQEAKALVGGTVFEVAHAAAPATVPLSSQVSISERK